MFYSCLKTFFIIFFISVFFTELKDLPTPFWSFKYLYNTNSSLITFVLWSFWSFIFIPMIFYLIVIIWHLKYNPTEPSYIPNIFQVLISVHENIILNSFLTNMFIYIAVQLGDIVPYFYLRFSGINRDIAISNSINIFLILTLYTEIFFFMLKLFYVVMSYIVLRASSYSNFLKLLKKNWCFLAGTLGFLAFYIINIFFILSRVEEMDRDYSLSIQDDIVGKYMVVLGILIMNIFDDSKAANDLLRIWAFVIFYQLKYVIKTIFYM